MRVVVKYLLDRPIIVDDSWPLAGYGIRMDFEREGENVSALYVNFLHQPVDRAPNTKVSGGSPAIINLQMGEDYKSKADIIVRKIISHFNLVMTIEVDFKKVDIEFVPENESERSALHA